MVRYEIYFYEDENHNNQLDNDELPHLPLYGKGKRLQILAITREAYEFYADELLDDIEFITPGGGSGEQLYRVFMSGASALPAGVGTSSVTLTYTEDNSAVGPEDDTPKLDALVQNWTHGAGVALSSDCAANIPVYTHPEGTALHKKRMKSSDFLDKFEKLIETSSKFKQRLADAVSGDQVCSDDEDYYCLLSFHNDIDVVFSSYAPSFPSADLAAALGASKMEVTLNVRAKKVLWGLLDHELSIEAQGEVFDFYDFNMGKPTNGFDFNTDGAWIQLGYEASRATGGIFITEVPFGYNFETTGDF